MTARTVHTSPDFGARALNDRELLESAGLAVVMPAVFTYTLEHNVMRFAQAAVRVWGCQMDFADPKRTALEGIEALRNFLISIGMPIWYSIIPFYHCMKTV